MSRNSQRLMGPSRRSTQPRFSPYPKFKSAKTPKIEGDPSSHAPSSAPFRKKWKEYQDRQKRRRKEQELDFLDKYSVCNPESTFHDLKCGHRVQSEYAGAYCGPNCKVSVKGYSFICPDCTVKDVRVQMELAGMSLSNNDDAEMNNGSPTREEKICKIADGEIRVLFKLGHKTCLMVNKFADPKMQFFDQFSREEGLGAIEGDEAKTAKPEMPGEYPAPTRTKAVKQDKSKIWESRQPNKEAADDDDPKPAAPKVIKKPLYKRPRTKRIPATMQTRSATATAAAKDTKATDDLTEIVSEARVSLKIEDEVIKAVRESTANCKFKEEKK